MVGWTRRCWQRWVVRRGRDRRRDVAEIEATKKVRIARLGLRAKTSLTANTCLFRYVPPWSGVIERGLKDD